MGQNNTSQQLRMSSKTVPGMNAVREVVFCVFLLSLSEPSAADLHQHVSKMVRRLAVTPYLDVCRRLPLLLHLHRLGPKRTAWF